MKALILNSGLGSRMGVYTKEHPKCMTDISDTDSILSRQLRLLSEAGVRDVVMTTGYYDQVLIDYCYSLNLPLHYTFVKNPIFDQTNYIYSIYCAREVLMDEDILLLHGDLVFEASVLADALAFPESCMKVSSTLPLPEKDFKAVVTDGMVKKVGVEFFESAMEAQAMYKLNKPEWNTWLSHIIDFCESGKTKVYAEVALNEITDRCPIHILDVKDRLCSEIDNPDDLAKVTAALAALAE